MTSIDQRINEAAKEYVESRLSGHHGDITDLIKAYMLESFADSYKITKSVTKSEMLKEFEPVIKALKKAKDALLLVNQERGNFVYDDGSEDTAEETNEAYELSFEALKQWREKVWAV